MRNKSMILVTLVASMLTGCTTWVKKTEQKSVKKFYFIGKVEIDDKGVIHVDDSIVKDAKAVERILTLKLKDTNSEEQRHVQFSCAANQSPNALGPVLQAIADSGGIVNVMPKNGGEQHGR